jgi:protocatechuate 3,4-dioxygenase beta subunit
MAMSFAVLLLLAQVAQPQTPSASIEGTVRRLGTGEPVYRARVILNAAAVAGVLRTDSQKAATTDKDGHFSFGNLDAGPYTLQVYANGYVRQTYGQKAQNQPGTPIVLNAGQQKKDVLFEVTPTGTITGRIFDFDNVPLPDADVVLERFSYDGNGERTPQVVQQARTNDLGEYRLFWITPGKYYLRAELTGTMVPPFRNPNQYLGVLEDVMSSMYYPGANDLSSASEIEVLPGTQLSAIDLALVRTRVFTVRGRVVSANPGTAFVSLRPRRQSGPSRTPSASTKPDGTFEIRNVISGSYILQANGGGNIATALRNEIPVDVNGDTDSVVITLSPGFNLPFHVVFEDPSSVTTPDTLTNMRPNLRTVGNIGGISAALSGLINQPTIKLDGTFTIFGVLPGTYQLFLGPLPSPDHYIKAIRFGQTDALRDGISVDGPPDSPIEVLIGSNAGKIEGTVVDNEGKPVQGAEITFIPNERTVTSQFRQAGSDVNGHFTARGVFPAGYRLFAWDGIEANAYRDPEFIRRFEQQGKAVSIGEGSNPAVELHVIKIP